MKKYLFIISFLFASCTPIIKWQTEYPDNYLEEYLEELIKESTDKDIDFTPFTGEERQEVIE